MTMATNTDDFARFRDSQDQIRVSQSERPLGRTSNWPGGARSRRQLAANGGDTVPHLNERLEIPKLFCCCAIRTKYRSNVIPGQSIWGGPQCNNRGEEYGRYCNQRGELASCGSHDVVFVAVQVSEAADSL